MDSNPDARSVHSRDPDCAAAIREPDVELVEVLNEVPGPVSELASALIQSRALAASIECREITVDASSGEVTGLEDFETAARAHSDPATAEHSITWLKDWLQTFARVSDSSHLGLRLAHSRGPTCPRFHVDHVQMRLIATLTGEGTEWIPGPVHERSSDGRISQDASDKKQLEPASVGFFKGALFGEQSLPGIVHRSPLGTDDRVVLTVDAVQ